MGGKLPLELDEDYVGTLVGVLKVEQRFPAYTLRSGSEWSSRSHLNHASMVKELDTRFCRS